jgi:hypothetical protein
VFGEQYRKAIKQGVFLSIPSAMLRVTDLQPAEIDRCETQINPDSQLPIDNNLNNLATLYTSAIG